jgi:hypothetical protein
MAILTCGTCGCQFSLVRTGKNKFTTNYGNQTRLCPVVKERAAQSGSTSDFSCEHMEDAIQTAIRERRV